MKGRLLSIVILVALLLAGLTFTAEAQTCQPVYHVVKPGQNLTQIANYYGVTVQAIVNANNLWNPNLIYTGQRLLIPVDCQPKPPKTCTTTHVVKRGEYLKLIAARYGTTWQAIANLNGLTNPNLIYPGQRLKVPVKCTTPVKPTPTPPTPTGPWTGKYWDNRFFSGTAKYTRSLKSVAFDWGTAGPGNGIGGQNYAIRFTRVRYFDPGLYRFYVKVDDGVRVWIDDVKIIDQWHDSAPTMYTADRQLSAGNHTMQIDYYQNTGAAQITFWPERIDSKAAWKGVYYNNTSLADPVVATASYDAINFDWGTKAPAAAVSADYFSARFTGTFYFIGGSYRFTATADDGIRVWVDDKLIIDQWHATSARTYVADVDVGEGDHTLKIEYFEEKGDAVCQLRWTQR
jgi:LysM repeat protein